MRFFIVRGIFVYPNGHMEDFKLAFTYNEYPSDVIIQDKIDDKWSGNFKHQFITSVVEISELDKIVLVQ